MLRADICSNDNSLDLDGRLDPNVVLVRVYETDDLRAAIERVTRAWE